MISFSHLSEAFHLNQSILGITWTNDKFTSSHTNMAWHHVGYAAYIACSVRIDSHIATEIKSTQIYQRMITCHYRITLELVLDHFLLDFNHWGGVWKKMKKNWKNITMQSGDEARHGPWPVRKRFNSVQEWHSRSKPGCWIVGSHTRWLLTTAANDQSSSHCALWSTGVVSAQIGRRATSRFCGWQRVIDR